VNCGTLVPSVSGLAVTAKIPDSRGTHEPHMGETPMPRIHRWRHAWLKEREMNWFWGDEE
jgi:hypothetical protein